MLTEELRDEIVNTSNYRMKKQVDRSQDPDTEVKLLNILDTRYDEEELRTLSFQLSIDYDDLRGSGKKDKARELILLLKRRNRIEDLVETGKSQRPDIDDWPSIR